MSEFSLIMSHWGNDTLQLLRNLSLYTGVGTLEFWQNLHSFAIIAVPLNITSIFLVFRMRRDGICPSILNEFPFRVIFPKTIGGILFLMLSYIFFFVILANWMIEVLS